MNAASYDSASQSLRNGKVLLRLRSPKPCRPGTERFYTGLTDDFPMRLKRHNSGQVLHTAKWKPWRLKTYVAFSDRSRTAQFERYLKSSSGRAFLKKRL